MQDGASSDVVRTYENLLCVIHVLNGTHCAY